MNRIVGASILAACVVIPAPAQTPAEREQGFESLLPGPGSPAEAWECWGWNPENRRPPDCGDEPAWIGFPEDGSVGKITSAPNLQTARAWTDFDARWEFRSGAFSSFHYRIQPDADGPPMWFMGYAMAGDRHPDGPSGTDWDLYRSKPDTVRYRPVDGWHAARVVALGDSIEHWLNGEKVVAYRIGSPDFLAHLKRSSRFTHPHFNNALPVDSAHPLMRAGPIGWAVRWSGSLRIRNFRIAELPLRPVSLARPSMPAARGSTRSGALILAWPEYRGYPHDLRGRRD